jgi:hypothetical protein
MVRDQFSLIIRPVNMPPRKSTYFYQLLDLDDTYYYGVRKEGQHYVIGSCRMEIKSKYILIRGEKFFLTHGLMELLTRNFPKGYSNKDLSEYKKILLLSNAHKKEFDSAQRIVCSRGWKYLKVIAKLFPSKKLARAKVKKIVKEKIQTTTGYGRIRF